MLLLMFGSVYGCALEYYDKYNPQPRDNLQKRSILMDNVIQFVRQEKKTFKQRIDEIIHPKK